MIRFAQSLNTHGKRLSHPRTMVTTAGGGSSAFSFRDALELDDLLTDEEKGVRDAARQYARGELLPRVTEAFRKEHFDVKIMREMGELGLLGSTCPPEYGGAGLGYVGYGLVAHEIEAVDSGYRSAMSVQSSLVCSPILEFGSEEQKKKWLPELIKGRVVGCFGLTEPEAGSDPAGMKTTATRDGTDYILNGTKTWITNSPIAHLLLVWAKVSDEKNSIRGFLIDREAVKQGKLTTAKIEGKLSLRASITGQIALDDVRVSAAQSLLPNVRGMKGPFSCLNKARYGIAWGAMGAAGFCFEHTREYTLMRKQFGRPLAHNQLQQVKFADMMTEISLGLNAALRVGRILEGGKVPVEAISLIKRNNCGKALNIARVCRDMLGGNGISDEYHVMRIANNLEAVNTYEGAHDVHALILGRAITNHSAF